MDEILQMSSKELSRLEVMQRLVEKRMSQKEASRVLGVSVRHVKRLLHAYRLDGAETDLETTWTTKQQPHL